jgi:hypothetical protein
VKAIGSGTSLLRIFSEPKSAASLLPLPAGVFVLRHLADAARTGLRYAGEDHRPPADLSADQTAQAALFVFPGRPDGMLPPTAERRTRKVGGIVARRPHHQEWKRTVRRQPAGSAVVPSSPGPHATGQPGRLCAAAAGRP